MATLCFLPCAPQQPRLLVRPAAGGAARCTRARLRLRRRPRTRVPPCGVRMISDDSDGPAPAATAAVNNKDATAQGPTPPPLPLPQQQQEQQQVRTTTPTPRAVGRGDKDRPLPVMNMEDRQEALEMYYDADDTTYQANLANVWVLGSRNFAVELSELFRFLRRTEPPPKYAPPACLGLTLSDAAVAAREQQREAAREASGGDGSGGRPAASAPVMLLYRVLCRLIDTLFVGRPIPRMWFLEVVARIPYFSYTSCLHLLSTLGWWRSPELMNIHHAEELNEAFHLAVMESLGGDRRWSDRFMAFHAAIAYYWFLVVMFFLSPASSYGFSELLEGHAVDTYAQLLEENAETLRALPAPDVARVYFEDFIYYFDAFQMERDTVRRPDIHSLYDVFVNIFRDEEEHVKTMKACREYTSEGKRIKYKGRDLRSKSRASRKPMSADEKRAYWKRWTKSKM